MLGGPAHMCCTWFCCSYMKNSHMLTCCSPSRVVVVLLRSFCVSVGVCAHCRFNHLLNQTHGSSLWSSIRLTDHPQTVGICLECFHYICIAAQRVQFICLTCAYSSLTDVEPSVGKRFAFVVCVCVCVYEWQSCSSKIGLKTTYKPIHGHNVFRRAGTLTDTEVI